MDRDCANITQIRGQKQADLRNIDTIPLSVPNIVASKLRQDCLQRSSSGFQRRLPRPTVSVRGRAHREGVPRFRSADRPRINGMQMVGATPVPPDVVNA